MDPKLLVTLNKLGAKEKLSRDKIRFLIKLALEQLSYPHLKDSPKPSLLKK